jgi:hypothetical protein
VISRENIRWGVRGGLLAATGYSVWASAVYLVRGPGAFDQHGTSLPEIIVLYFVGGLIAGAVVGALRPLTESREGMVVVGVVAALPILFALFFYLFGSPEAWSAKHWFLWVILSLVCGVSAGAVEATAIQPFRLDGSRRLFPNTETPPAGLGSERLPDARIEVAVYDVLSELLRIPRDELTRATKLPSETSVQQRISAALSQRLELTPNPEQWKGLSTVRDLIHLLREQRDATDRSVSR